MIKLTKTQKEFIGSQFQINNCGTLTVIDIVRDADGNPEKIGSNVYFHVMCSICNEDKELFPLPFKSTKSNLTSGNNICGCGKRFKWSEEQNKIRIKRKCSGYNYIFHGWFGDYLGNRTYLDLENPKTGNRWVTCRMDSFLNGVGDPIEGKDKISEAITLPDEYHINEFHRAGLSDKFEFWRSDKLDSNGYKPYWYYTCPLCSTDEYVQNDLCSGVFEANSTDLKSGSKSCRCSKHFRWNKEQREFKLKLLCNDEGGKFCNWENTYKNSKSRFKWLCRKEHDCMSSVNDFLSGYRCSECASYGFNPSLPASLYVVLWYGDVGKYLKFGITNREVITRIKEQQRETSSLNYKILYKFHHNNGYIIEQLEKDIKRGFDTGSCIKEWLPDGYTETIDYTEDNKNRLLEMIKMGLNRE